MATYSTDLTTLTNAESGTFTELTGTILGFTLSGAGSPSADGENFIQGTDCRSQTTGKAVDAEISIVFDYGSGYSFSAGHVVFGWCFYAVGVNLKTKANSGWMFVICDSTTTGDYFVIGGSDYGRNPYGGWMNVAIDPTATESGTLGAGGNGGTYRYFGQVCNTLNEIAKGTPSAIDAIRVGRGIISITGSGGSFAELASYNDYNAGSTPPGSGSTSLDSGRHRLGLFQENGGTYLWKGLLSLGTTGASVTFSDSNETIIIDDCPYTYASFNKIEINNASSIVTLSNISIISTATTVNGKGYFEMVDNASVTKSGCLFLNMGTFIYQSGGTINGTSYVACDQITHGGATFDKCTFQGYEGTAGTGYMIYNIATDPNGELDDCTFVKGTAATHAIQFGTSAPLTMSLSGCTFTGYNASNQQNDSTFYFPDTGSDVTWTLNLTNCSGNTSYYKARSGDTVNVSSSVDVTITVKDVTGTVIQNAQTGVFTTDDNTQIINTDTNASGIASGSYAGTTPREVKVWIRKASSGATKYKNYSSVQNITSTGLTLDVTLIVDPNNNATT